MVMKTDHHLIMYHMDKYRECADEQFCEVVWAEGFCVDACSAGSDGY
jgi:hypothetical protein